METVELLHLGFALFQFLEVFEYIFVVVCNNSSFMYISLSLNYCRLMYISNNLAYKAETACRNLILIYVYTTFRIFVLM